MIETTLGGRPVAIHRPTPGIEYPSGLAGLDVETTYLTDRAQFDPDFRVRTVQLAWIVNGNDLAYVFDVTDPEQRATVERLLSDPCRTFASHTPMDVLSVWREFGIDISARNIDTRSLAIMANPDKLGDRDLKSLATEYGMPELEDREASLFGLFVQMWTQDKPDGKGHRNAKRADIERHGWSHVDTSDETFLIYAALDAVACRRLAEILIPATRAPFTLLDKEWWLDTQANRITMRGVRVDVDRLAGLLKITRGIAEGAKREAEKITEGVNINGPKIIDWLAEHGADWSRWEEVGGVRTKTGAPSLADGRIALLSNFDLDPFAGLVVEHMLVQAEHVDTLRKCEAIEKRLVIESLIPGNLPDTGGFTVTRIHPELNPRGATTTARMSSAGPNMQNFSKSNPMQRGLFLPEPGHVLATIDFAQIELRVVAALAREEVMIETIRAGRDLHRLTVDLLAAQGIEITRQTAKMANFLIVYGGGPTALSVQAKIPLDTAASVVYGMREQYPSIEALRQYLGREKNGIRTISNRWLPVTVNRKTGELRSYATINYAVQSAARELLVDAWWKFEEIHGRHGRVWWPVHDELVLQIPEDEVEETLRDAEAAMSWRDFMGVPIEASAIVLLDEHGVSRWMPGDVAEKIAREKVTV